MTPDDLAAIIKEHKGAKILKWNDEFFDHFNQKTTTNFFDYLT